MKAKSSLALFLLLVFLAGCTSLQTGGELQYGRQALLKGSNETALGYFLQRRSEGSQLRVCDRELSQAGRLELRRTVRVSYQQNSPSPAKLGASACRQ